MKKLILPLITIILFSSCNNTVFKKYNKFENLSWNRLNYLNFEIPVEKNEELDFYLALRHHTNFPYNYINVNVTLFTPDGEMRSLDYHFRLKNIASKWKGECMGELCDIELPIRNNMIFNKSGTCKVRVENKMMKVETPGIIEVGLIVKKAN